MSLRIMYLKTKAIFYDTIQDLKRKQQNAQAQGMGKEVGGCKEKAIDTPQRENDAHPLIKCITIVKGCDV